MPNDYITLKAIATELTTLLQDGRINKINMPSADELILSIRAGGKNHTLYISAAASLPRIHLTVQKFNGGITPSTYCMLLRKHLTNGAIKNIAMLNCDRVCDINIISHNELHDITEYHLVFELMGGGSNIILCDSDYKILEATRRMFGEGVRPVLQGYPYTPPSQNKLTPESGTALQELDTIPAQQRAAMLPKLLVGLSKETLAETLLRANDGCLSDCINMFNSVSKATEYAPCVALDSENTPTGFFVMPYRTISAYRYQPTAGINEAADIYYAKLGSADNKNKQTKQLRAHIKKAIARAQKRLADNAQKLEESAKKDATLHLGEILKCNLHLVKKGDIKLLCYDFYNDCDIVIALDAKLSPQKNAEYYFKKYNKLKGQEAYALKEKEDIALQLEYLNSILASVDSSDTLAEYKEIEAELANAIGKGNKAQPQKGAKKEKKSPPLCLKIDGYTVYIGKNHQQNDEITFNYASGGDIWLHTKRYHGAHGIIICGGAPVANSIIAETASIVAYYSTARDSNKVEVDYTARKNVKKLGKPGLVTYSKEKTILVSPTKES